ncbi:MAG: putative toxin-antitoxin system toxin component, PIN family [Anaerolineae bacterium CG_4_9_14_0_8_um_filter_58_9]|nr:MAG: putative toxin-antitoxin system toxin component, PIN family [Anaerolineae bacterium CG_4_9_14_0_8_um_filter_58_9]
MMRVVIDTNVLISAVIKPKSRMGLIIQCLHQSEYTLVFSPEMLEELVEVYSRPKIQQKYHLDQEALNTIVGVIVTRGDSIVPTTDVNICRDPDDDMLLSLALDGHADYIVSGDGGLLSLSPFQGIPIIKPAEFLNILDK